MIKKLLLLIAVFLLGALTNTLDTSTQTYVYEPPKFLAGYYNNTFDNSDFDNTAAGIDKASPQDWIKEDQIRLYKNKVVIEIKDPEWSAFTDTNSMDPLIDYGANAIYVKPESEEKIQVGDIVLYESEYADKKIAHRVVYKGQDEEGVYFITKGDNSQTPDGIKVRFRQILGIVVAIIY